MQKQINFIRDAFWEADGRKIVDVYLSWPDLDGQEWVGVDIGEYETPLPSDIGERTALVQGCVTKSLIEKWGVRFTDEAVEKVADHFNTHFQTTH